MLTCLQFSDVSRLLNTYQLWLDDLFPKANFADGLSIIEKVGHSRRMQMLRREWIDEEKRPKESTPPPEEPQQDSGDIFMSGARQDSADRTHQDEDDSLFVADTRQNDQSPAQPENDLYAAPSPRRPAENGGVSRNNGLSNEKPTAVPDEDDLDDLDALLAEESAGTGSKQPSNEASSGPHDNFDDDEAAMAEMDML